LIEELNEFCPTAWSQGDTQEEALQNIKEAIAGYLKTLNDRAIGGMEWQECVFSALMKKEKNVGVKSRPYRKF